VLAGVLLKLGAYGLYRVTPLLSASGSCAGVLIFSLVGGAVISSLCVRLIDLKVLVAYSSVAHISLVITSLLSQRTLGTSGALAISLAHGIASSALFFGVGVLYAARGSRLFFFNARVILWSP
jgi:NADH:ubiquinone oxidoreductase subunit 4 (subunit M)